MTQPPVPPKPTLAWLTLLFGAILLLVTAPASIVLLLVPFFKPDEISVMWSILTAFMLVLPVVTIWLMIRSFKIVKAHQLAVKEAALLAKAEKVNNGEHENSFQTKKPYWPWLVIAPGAILLIFSGPGAVMFPIMPLFLAGMSTDSGQIPDYVPALLIFGGYGLMTGYGVLVWQAIKTLRAR